MSERYLTIMEVSQKQNYIFSSNRLSDNVANSDAIVRVMSGEFFEKEAGEFFSSKNFVYSGGGHVVLEFDSREKAVEFTKKVTLAIHEQYPDMEVFAKTVRYDENLTVSNNIKNLTKELEKKKSLRRASFHNGSFGVEKINSETLKPERVSDKDNETRKARLSPVDEEIEKILNPLGFRITSSFEDLGGSVDESNFIAVVHIDGNAMGKSVTEFSNRFSDWNGYVHKDTGFRAFSEAIDADFKAAYKEMITDVAKMLNESENPISQLDLQTDKNGLKNFPIRRIITAGDDICFVTEGRIGIECAALFIEKLKSKVNEKNGKPYSACAGVAIVHRKYPFYKAYELAEALCSNAKKFGAEKTPDKSGSGISSIDWHLEFGEVQDSLEQIKEEYNANDGTKLRKRPYIVDAPDDVIKENKDRTYDSFRQLVQAIQDNEKYPRGIVKNLRAELKQGKIETEYYLKFHKMSGMLNKTDELFDAIEVMDTYIALGEE